MMTKLILWVITVFLFTIVASEWIALPVKISSKGVVTQSSNKVNTYSFQSLTTEGFKKIYEIEATSSPKMETDYIEQTKMAHNHWKMLPNSYSKDLRDDVDNFSILTNNSNSSHTKSGKKNTDEDSLVDETIEEAKHEFLVEPRNGSIEDKLKYLKQLEHTLLSHLRMSVKSLWTDRQARGKKLLGFPSMEGALMTIAFLTFAVFLIKIVMQFIQGLQNAEQTLLMTLASTPTPVRLSNRPKRSTQNLAAAQILRYIDEFSIKHKHKCDF